MILAGIDEAGLGPTLGPLVTASLALRCPDGWVPDSPWEKMPDVFRREAPKKNAGADPLPIPVADSKQIYRPGGGLRLLEMVPALFNSLVHDREGFVFECGAAHPCYRFSEPWPCSPGDSGVADRLRRAFAEPGVEAAHFAVHPLYEPDFNRILETGKNKNELILQETGRHLTALVSAFAPRHSLLIVVDKQGGRNAYAPYLASLFPRAWPRELEAGREISRYFLTGFPHSVEIRFQAKADQTSFCTAAASMAAKYVREIAMQRFNGWFAEKLPDLAPTAGYPTDAKRWLRDVGERSDELLVDLVVRRK